jgi:hypothetical protein
MRSFLRVIVAAGAAAAAAGFAPANAAVCKGHSHIGNASGAFEGLTSLKARAAWRAEVRSHEGIAWALWQLARFKTTKCAKAGEKGSWSCVARARPCRAGS